MQAPFRFRPRVESLDDRTLPSITLNGNLLIVGGTGGNDVVRVTAPNANQLQVSIDSTGEVRRFAIARVTQLRISTGNGNDRILLSSGLTSFDAEIYGGKGNDVINGGGGNDQLFGGRGNDVLRGRGGNDTMHGDEGNDRLYGDDGNDTMFGDAGDDIGYGGDGDDTFDGGTQRDGFNGEAGNDTVINAVNLEIELAANLTGTSGTGTSAFGFDVSPAEHKRDFDVSVQGLTPSTNASVAIDGFVVGGIPLNATGAGTSKITVNYDGSGSGTKFFNFPEIRVGSTITIRVGNAIVLQGTFAAV